MRVLLGAHVSAAGGHARAFERARAIGADCLQIFTRAPSRWRGKPLTAAEVRAFRAEHEASGGPAVLAHDMYLTNLAAEDPHVFARSLESLIDEVCRCHQLGLDGLVLHLGSHLGRGEGSGLTGFIRGLEEVLRATPPLPLLLETTAGQGHCLGHRFEHLAEVLSRIGSQRLGVCLDTCHVFAAGYDLRTTPGYRRTFREFQRLIGMDRLWALHLNDSKSPLGSRLDRHAHIGQGMIGVEAFRRLVTDPRLSGIPMILETPEHQTMHSVNLSLLRQMAQERA